MRDLGRIVVLFASLTLAACAGTTEEPKTAAEANWSTFTGKFSGPLTNVKAAEPPPEAEQAAAAAPAAPAKGEESAPSKDASKKASRGTVKGESLSTISVEALTTAAKTTTKQKFVSNGIVTGSDYEMVSVEMKNAKVQVYRRASSPAANGPSIASPKAKQGALSKTEAGWYDEEADVLVVVSATKKGTAQKVLGNLVKK